MENLFDKVFFKHPVTRTIKHQNNQYGTLIIYGSATQLMSFFFQLLDLSLRWDFYHPADYVVVGTFNLSKTDALDSTHGQYR